MRDRADVQGNRCYGDICDVARTAGFDVAMSRLKQLLEAGEISLDQYRSNLIRTVTSSLINTIVVND